MQRDDFVAHVHQENLLAAAGGQRADPRTVIAALALGQPHELAERFAEQFRQPEMFMRVDGKIVAAPMPDEQTQGGMSY